MKNVNFLILLFIILLSYSMQAQSWQTEGNNVFLSDSAVMVGIGTDSPDNALDVCGVVRAEEVIVESDWADFVFEDDYLLPQLKDVEQFIDDNGHLPDIPSAKDVKANGVSVGEMNAKLLQKVEELTLYVIEQQKEIDELKRQISELE